MQKILRMRVLMHVHPQRNGKTWVSEPWRMLAITEKGRSGYGTTPGGFPARRQRRPGQLLRMIRMRVQM
ncbi:hypothetical protein [Actinocrinis sp.]|uniref:hypothetical protein n=1 Tax=Actinocrinis sp. TaxID=1920516 RepID=UPI002DDD270D|nr:hypothetical protein [Actinocrinis sp.]